ncbi:MAG: hypothetical protein JXR48_02645 [Candidatus Delongbacteria bacterium]|nr:hypothetical protein [Candidatus Delongbacteria bacterium]
MNQTEEAKKRAEVLLEDQNFVNLLEQAKTDNDIITAFAEKGVDVTTEDLIAVKKELQRENSIELKEEDLEEVQGGFIGLVVTYTAVVVVALILLIIAQRKASKRSSK